MHRYIAAVSLMLLIAPLHAHAHTLAREGRAQATIVTATEPTIAEQHAVSELADYLQQVTGAEFTVVAEAQAPGAGMRIFAGPTQFAADKGLAPDTLGPEEWVIRSFGDDLVITGGRPRGALYAVYRFLEDVVGVHWWNPWEEHVPRQTTLQTGELDLQGEPVLAYRDIYMLYSNDDGLFAARNRLNRAGDRKIAAPYGGCRDYGPPYHVHTFEMYIPPRVYGETKPEWFSLIGGQRVTERSQLCVTNEELREVFLEKLINYIETSSRAAREAGMPPPDVFSISANDWYSQCTCENCQAITQVEGSDAGPYMDFVNYMADGIKDEYPWVYIDTLAYFFTQTAPKTIKPRDNVIIRLCDTNSNFTRPITDEENSQFHNHLLSWSAIAKNLRIWDYAVTFARPNGLPLDTLHTYQADYQFYAENNVEGVFTEHEFPILADMRDLKVWMMMKLKEDPYADYDRLLTTFTDGFYGPAGPYVRQYLQALEQSSQEYPSYLSMGAAPPQFRYLTLDFVTRAHAIYDRAEEAVQDDATLLRRVRHCRLSLDRATVILFPRLVSMWVGVGNTPETMPLDRDAIADRYRQTWYEQAEFRLLEEHVAGEKELADAEVATYTARPAYVPLPERFRELAQETLVLDYTADVTRNWKDRVQVVDDNTESGMTNRFEIPDEELDRYRLPMHWGLYDQINKRGYSAEPLRGSMVPGPGYHWYRIGSYSVSPGTYLYFFWSWIIQLDIDNAYDRDNPNRQYEIWANVKFEGPAFPHGNAEDVNAISIERVVLVGQ